MQTIRTIANLIGTIFSWIAAIILILVILAFVAGSYESRPTSIDRDQADWHDDVQAEFLGR